MVGFDEEVLNRDILVAFGLGIGWQLRPGHLQPFFPIHFDLVHLASFVPRFRLAAFALRRMIRRGRLGWLLVGLIFGWPCSPFSRLISSRNCCTSSRSWRFSPAHSL